MGDSISYINGAASLFVGAIMVYIVSFVHGKLQPKANAATSGSADLAQGTTWMDTLVGNLPLVFLLVGALGIVAYSVLNRRSAV